MLFLEKHARKDGGQILHRDLKPGNILIDENDDVKLADFGEYRSVGINSLSETVKGTPLYFCPNKWLNKGYTIKSEVWSVGVIAYELIFGTYPFYHEDERYVRKFVLEMNFPLPDDFNDESIISMLVLMLHKDEKYRLSFEFLLTLPVLNQEKE
jgi:serine/threonine protein kinase